MVIFFVQSVGWAKGTKENGMQIASQFRIRLPFQVQVSGSREDWTEAHGIAFQLKIEIGKNKNTIHYKLLKVLPFR